MSSDLLPGMVRILRPGGVTAGAGFVVSEAGLIATCAHVVQSESEQKRHSRPDKVEIVFHATGQRVEAYVLPEGWRDSDQEDVAFLKIEGDLPPGVHPLPLSFSTGTADHRFRSFGFPDSNTQGGLHAKGHVLKDIVIDETRSPALQLSSKEITNGFSGGPVWDTTGKRVIGMISLITIPELDSYRRLDETAFATPAETLQRLCPDLQLLPPEKRVFTREVVKQYPLIPKIAVGIVCLFFLLITGLVIQEKLPMTGDINIAIADFGQTESARGFAEAIANALQRELQSITSPLKVQFRRIGPIKDYAQAKQWAHEHQVNLLIWGYLSKENPTTYAVQFYIRDPQEGGEITDKLSTPSGDSELVKQRVEISVMFAKGLVYLFTAKPSEAADQFEFARELADAANQTNSDPDGIGSVMDTLYFYKGRALSQIGNYDEAALAAYEQALSLNPDYTWAHLGIGNLYFTKATAGPTDLPLLDQALGEYQAVLTVTNPIHLPPAAAYITAKAQVNIGNVYSIRAGIYQNKHDWPAFAEMIRAADEAYQAALTEYEKAGQEQGEAVPARYPAKAQYGLGVLYELQGQMAEASRQYAGCAAQAAADPDPRASSLKDLCEKRYLLVSPTSVPPTPQEVTR